jgi:hypothetical protein
LKRETLRKSRDTLYSFFETPIFMRQIEDRASLKMLFAIEDDLLKNPERGDIIPGTHGARKARIGDPDSRRGKRGSYRYIYAYFPGHHHTISCYTCLPRMTRPTYRPKQKSNWRS